MPTRASADAVNSARLIGTHNSCTGYPLKSWFRLLAPLAYLTARCQDRTIEEQYADGVRYFNLQVAWYKGDYWLSHGVALYDITLTEACRRLSAVASEVVCVDICLDNNFFCKYRKDMIEEYVSYAKSLPYIRVTRFIYEKEWELHTLDMPDAVEERYWTMARAKRDGRWWQMFPLPHFWAKRRNDEYRKASATAGYLILDFYEI